MKVNAKKKKLLDCVFCKSHLILTRLGHLSQRSMGQKKRDCVKLQRGKYKAQDSYNLTTGIFLVLI